MECLHPIRKFGIGISRPQKFPKSCIVIVLKIFGSDSPGGPRLSKTRSTDQLNMDSAVSSFQPTLSSSDWNWDKESIACTGACQVHPMQIMTKNLAIYLVPLIQGLKAVIFMHGDVATSADEFQLLRQTAEISWNVDMEAHEIMNLI